MIYGKDIVSRLVKKFSITPERAVKILLSTIDKEVEKKAELYITKAEIEGSIEFPDLLRIREELTPVAQEAPVKVPVLKK